MIAEKRKVEEEARKKQLEEQARLKKEEDEAKKRAEELAAKARAEEAQRAKAEEAERARQAEEARAREALAAKNTPVVKPADTVTAPVPVVPKERHETVKRGSHPKELPVGDYIIAGVFSSEANAIKYAGGLKQLAYKGDNGYLSRKGLWYVYIYHSNDINEARIERDKFRKMRMFKDAWLLTIHD